MSDVRWQMPPCTGGLGTVNKNVAGETLKETSPANLAGARGQDSNVYEEMGWERWGRSRIVDTGYFSSSYDSVHRLDACRPYPRPRLLRPRDFHCRDVSD